jgi:cytochrome oxidase assembly protein ShyY1
LYLPDRPSCADRGGSPREPTGYRDGVYRFLLAPRWIAAHLLLIAAVAVCLILGSWQADAFRDSKSRHDARDQAPVPVRDLVDVGADTIDGVVDRAVMLTGEFDPSAQVLIPGRVLEDTLGSYVVSVFRDDTGLEVPVVRGWLDEPTDPGAQAPTGTVEVTGHLLSPESEDKAVTRSDRPLEAGQISHLDPELIGRELPSVDAARLLPGYVVVTGIEPTPEAMPVPVSADDIDPIRDVSPWQNASYWAQWWVFALAAVVFWASAVRAAVRSRKVEVSEPDRAPAPS